MSAAGDRDAAHDSRSDPTWSGRRSPTGCSPSSSRARRSSQTPCRLDVGAHAFGVHAFVCRQPDENHERVYRWLLERNLRMYGVAFAVDAAGDIYLDGRLPLAAVTPEEVDRLLGSVLTLRRRLVQHDPGARLRLLHPQGVGLAQEPW